MLPEQDRKNGPECVKYFGKEYDNLGIIELNNGNFLVLKSDDDIIYLDMSNINSSFFDLKKEIKKSTKVEKVFMDFIVESIKSSIRNGKYQTKEDLKKEIFDLNKYINNHLQLLNNLHELDFKDEIVNAKICELLSYFDEVMPYSPLDLEGITSFQVDGKYYIKYIDENNRVRILDDNVENRNFVEQFKSKQNETEFFKQEDGKESALNIAEDMREYQKKEIDLENISQDNEDLTISAMQNYNQTVNKNIIGNVDTGIFYDENNQQLLNTKEEENKIVINQVNESTHNEVNSQAVQPNIVKYPEYNEEVITQLLIKGTKFNIDIFIKKYLYDLTNEQIDILLNNYTLTEQQITQLTEQKSKLSQPQNVEKPKTLILTRKDTPKAAFIDTLLLSFIVGLVSGMYLVFLILLIFS